jgi:hypothetical protein
MTPLAIDETGLSNRLGGRALAMGRPSGRRWVRLRAGLWDGLWGGLRVRLRASLLAAYEDTMTHDTISDVTHDTDIEL